MFCSQSWTTCDKWKSSPCLSKSNSSSGPRWALGLCGITAPSICSFCISSNGRLKHHFLRFHFKLKRLLQKVRDSGRFTANCVERVKTIGHCHFPQTGPAGISTPFRARMGITPVFSSHNPNSRYCLSFFFQLEYSCFTTLCTLCCTAEWLSHIFIYIPSFRVSFITEHWAEFPEPHRRFSLAIYFIFSIKSGRRQWHLTRVLLPGKSQGRRSLVGCSPWGH